MVYSAYKGLFKNPRLADKSLEAWFMADSIKTYKSKPKEPLQSRSS
jgi:hypothetical protein